MYKVLGVKHLTENTIRLRTERPNYELRAGQCFNLGLPGLGINREYSIYSGENDPFLEFLIRVVDGGYVSTRLGDLRVGDLIELDGPFGEFCIPTENPNKNSYLFIATGTGIAPFHSFVRTFPNLEYTLLHGVRTEAEQYDSKDYQEGRYIPCLSQPSNQRSSMRVTDCLKEINVESNSHIYLCGNRSMIVDVLDIFSAYSKIGFVFSEVFF